MSAGCYFPRIHMGEQHNEQPRSGRVHVRWWAVAVALAAGISLLVVGTAANADSSITVTQDDFELTCPTNTVAEGASLTCTLTNTAADAKPWPAVAILHLSTDTDRALVRGTSVDVNLGAPSPAADIDGGVTWIGDTLVGYSRFDWSGIAGAKDAAGDSRTVNIVAAHDGVDEDSESFYVALGPDASKGVGLLFNNKASVTLTDNDSPSTDTSLSSLEMFAGHSYTLSATQAAASQAVAYEVTEATLTAAAARGTTMTMSASFDGNSVDLDGSGGTSIEVTSGEESAAVPLGVGTTTVTLTVTAEDGTTTGTRTLSIARSALADDVDTVAVSLPSFTLTCPAEVKKGTDAQCTLRASSSAGWPVVAIMHSSADGASRALVAEDPIIPDTHPDYSKDVSLGAQQPARTAFNHGYGELFSGGSRALYRTYGYEKFDWSGTASARDSRTVTIQLHDNAGSRGYPDEVFYVALAPSDYTGLSRLVDNKVPVVIGGLVPVTGVEVVSDAGGDDTYAMGEEISVQVTFGEAVDVTGAPTLGIDMGSGARVDAVYSSGSGTAELTFAHQVAESNVSSQGIAVLADTLALNGGTIRTTADGDDVSLGHSGLDHDPEHKVDWQRSPNTAPVFGGESVTHNSALPGSLVTLNLSKDDFSDPDGDEMAFTLSASRSDVHAADGFGYIEGSGSVWFRAKTACALAELDAPSGDAYDTVIKLTATDPEGASASATATFRTDPDHFACPSLSEAVVDGSTLTIGLEADGALPSGVIDPPTADDFEVKVNGATVSLADTDAVTASSTEIVLTLASPVTAGQIVTVSYAPDGNPVAAVFTDHAVTNDTSVSVTGVEVISDTGDDVYGQTEVIAVRVTFSEPVDVTGWPTLGIDMDPASWGRKDARYLSGSGTAELVFTHEVYWPNISTQGIAVLADTLSVADGSIRSVSMQIDADLAHDGLDHDPDHTVDWRRRPDTPLALVIAMLCDNLFIGDRASLQWTLTEPALDSRGEPSVAGSLVVGSCKTWAPHGGTISWSLTGADAARFEISSVDQNFGADPLRFEINSVGQLSFAEAPDFELPADSDSDNVYEVTVTATVSGWSQWEGFRIRFTESVDVIVTVTDLYEAPPVVVVPDPDAPTSAAVSGAELTLTFDEELAALDDATVQALRWAFLVDGAYHHGALITNQTPSAVAVDGSTITLTLSTAVAAGDDATVRYIAASVDNSLKYTDGTPLADFTATLTTTQRD